MWIHVYCNWKANFNSKISNKRSFSYETKASISLIPSRRMCLWFPIMKRKEIIMWIQVYPNWKTYFNSKIGNEKGFYYETKATLSLIPTKRMYLWCQIMKGKEIIMWIHVYSNWNTNFNSKKGNKRSFSYNTKASISLIPMRRTCLWCPIMKWNEITIWIHVYPNWKTYFNSKIGNKRSFSFETKASISLIPMTRMCLQCVVTKWNEITIWIHVYLNWKTYVNSEFGKKKVFLLKPKHQYH